MKVQIVQFLNNNFISKVYENYVDASSVKWAEAKKIYKENELKKI